MRVLIATLPFLQQQSKGQDRAEHIASPPPIRPFREWNNAYLVAISPTGDKLCLYFTKHPLAEFTFSDERLTYKGESPEDELFTVFELASPSPIYSAPLPARPSVVSFFGDTNSLYLEALFPPYFRAGQRIVIDLQGGRSDRSNYSTSRDGSYTHYYALNSHVLLGVEAEPNPTRAVALLREMLPDYREIARTPYTLDSVDQDDSVSHYWSPVISADRKSFAYMLGHTIVLRRAADLSVVWTHKVELTFFGVEQLAINANGSRVAAAVLDFVEKERHANDFIGVYDGLNGQSIARLRVTGKDGFAISPDGTLVASVRVLHKNRGVELLADVYDVKSGRLLATYEHDVVPPGKYQYLTAKMERIEFTSDGKYLVTSGNNRVRVWQF
jgi:hypothetical protein